MAGKKWGRASAELKSHRELPQIHNTYSPPTMSASADEVLQRKPTNIAVQTNPEHDLHVAEVEVPQPGPNDCLVHVRATGICGSDVHFWKHGRIGPMIVCGENGLGHESSGVVIRVGENVTRFKPGPIPILLFVRLWTDPRQQATV